MHLNLQSVSESYWLNHNMLGFLQTFSQLNGHIERNLLSNLEMRAFLLSRKDSATLADSGEEKLYLLTLSCHFQFHFRS